ncbi:MAG: GIY-YIG nuclease family protein [Patescibacteria group bacterium]
MRSYWVYILTNWNNKILYIGVTNDLRRRVYEHKNKLVEGFTKKYNVSKLVYFEEFQLIDEAIASEKKMKGWIRIKKVSLIESRNSEWKDLSLSF